ncbi:MAG: pilus assembly protein PilP [Gammaproteobacteria bacterium]|nr:pilus assembly protein PilP [Gammaproteobacteria bacterium]
MSGARWHGIRWTAPVAAVTIGCSPAPAPEPGTATAPSGRPPASVPAHPAVRPAPPFRYEAGTLRDPFEPPVSEWDRGADHGLSPAPDLQRARTALEGFEMEELRVVGILAARDARAALVRDPGGHVHAVRVGDYVGRDFGRVEAIEDTGLVLLEAIADGSGDWVTRVRNLPMHAPDAGARQPPGMEPRGDA